MIPHNTRVCNRAAIGVLAAIWAGTLWIYSALPQTLPTHWNIHGQADAFMPKQTGSWLVPALATVLFLFLSLLPRFAARLRTGGDSEMLAELRLWLLLFHGCVHALLLGNVLGSPLSVASGTPLIMGLLFYALGTSIGRLRESGPITMNTPWPVRSQKGRERLQRAVGLCMKSSGAAMVFSAMLPPYASVILILLAVTGMVAAILVCSHRIASQETGSQT